MTTRIVDILLPPDTHANRPATAAKGALFPCTTHSKLEQYTTAWADYFAGGSSSGGITQSYVGKNAVGATWETLVGLRVYAKKITLSTPGQLSTIEAHLRQSGGAAGETRAGLYTDVSGTPGVLLAQPAPGSTYLSSGSTVGRWFCFPVGMWLAAADYWIAVFDISAVHDIAVDTSGGTDRTYTSNTTAQADWGFFTPTTTSKDYSIRASIVR
jgi:hypothetical protein